MQERNRGELAAVNQERPHAFVFSFPFLSFSSVVVRSSRIEVFGMAAVWRGYNELCIEGLSCHQDVA